MRPTRVVLLSLFAALPIACESTGGGSDAESSRMFRDGFDVVPSQLVPSGRGTFFDLTPGTVLVLRDEEELVTITVLDETRVVDGVTTRVVQEREEKDGMLIEVSRNFFALDPATNDVYYFGEEVDVYANGVIDSHPGAWASGAKDSHFGLAVPGRPTVGDRYFQEIAPDVAMDRGEVISIDETVETPAGTFEHCLHVRETTPLEKGVGHKWYAPGIGLVKDDDCALVSHVRGGR